ncbi:MAG: secretin N-terminal domain-containing protein, partial [Candidatus Omnitrophota bacterium]
MSSADGWRRLIQRKLFWALIAVIAATGCVTAAIAADAPNPAAVPDAAAAQSKTASSESSEKPRTAEAGTMSAGLPASDAPFDTKSLESSINQNISLDLRDMDIVDVLKFLSLKGKFNLAINRSIQGRATLSMKSVSIKNALDIIVKSNGLAYYWVNNILYVLTAEEYVNTYGKKFDDRSAVRIFNLRYAKPSYVLATLDSLKSNLGKVIIDEDTGSVILIDTEENLEKMIAVLKQVDVSVVTTTFKLQYAQAKDIAAQLKQKLDAKSVGSIQADDRSNQVIVTALPDRLVEVEKLIKDLDAPTKGVLIEVRILQITLNPQFDFGINWSNPFAQTGIGFLKDLAVSQVFPISATNIGGTVGSFAYGASSPQELQMAI